MTKWTLLAIFSLSALITFTQPVQAQAPTPTERLAVAQISARGAALDAWLDRLIQKESNGSSTLVVVDTNGKLSIGCLQFQEATWERYTKRFGVAGADIFNCADQREVARRMVEEDPNAWRNWYTSVVSKGLGYPPVR